MGLFIGEGRNEGKNMYMKIFWCNGDIETISLKNRRDFRTCLRWFSNGERGIRMLDFDDCRAHYNVGLIKKIEFFSKGIPSHKLEDLK